MTWFTCAGSHLLPPGEYSSIFAETKIIYPDDKDGKIVEIEADDIAIMMARMKMAVLVQLKFQK